MEKTSLANSASERLEHPSERRVQAAGPSTGAQGAPTNLPQGETTYNTSRDLMFLASRSKRAIQNLTSAHKSSPSHTKDKCGNENETTSSYLMQGETPADMQAQHEAYSYYLTARDHSVHPTAGRETKQRGMLAKTTREKVTTRDRSPFYAQAQKPPLHEHLRTMSNNIKTKARALQQESTPHNDHPIGETQHIKKLSEGENDADQEDGFATCNDELLPDIVNERYTQPEVTYL
jgi:hypothetical protein